MKQHSEPPSCPNTAQSGHPHQTATKPPHQECAADDAITQPSPTTPHVANERATPPDTKHKPGKPISQGQG